MKQFQLLVGLSLACLVFAGCARMPQPKPSIASDRYQAAEASLRYMMDAHSGKGKECEYYSAYAIESGEFTTQLLAAFADYKPKVIADDQVSTNSGAALDKVTGKPVKIWSVEVLDLHDDRATAKVTWYVGNLGAGSDTLHLRRKNDKWIVESRERGFIS